MINPYLVNRGDLRPAHQHDCVKCEFQGMVEHDGQLYDVYLCPRDDSSVEGMKWTLLARFSSEGSEYLSFPLEIAEQIGCDRSGSKYSGFVQMVDERRLWVSKQGAELRHQFLARQEAVARLARRD